MYLIWRVDTTAKGAKKNTSPNVIHLQYHIKMRLIPVISVFFGFINWPIIDMISCPPWKSKVTPHNNFFLMWTSQELITLLLI